MVRNKNKGKKLEKDKIKQVKNGGKKHKNSKETKKVTRKRYGHTKLQREIIERGRKGELTVNKILEIFGAGNERSAVNEICKLREIGLIEIDFDVEGKIYENNGLIWIYDEEKLPYEPDEVIRIDITKLFDEKADPFLFCHVNHTCQRCGKKIEKSLKYVGLSCEKNEDSGLKLWMCHPVFTTILCIKCYSDLFRWLGISGYDWLVGVK